MAHHTRLTCNQDISSPPECLFVGLHIYTPDIAHIPGSPIPSPKHYIDTFRYFVRLQLHSHDKTHDLTTNERTLLDHDLATIIHTYNSPLILSIDGYFNPSTLPHIYPPHQPQYPTSNNIPCNNSCDHHCHQQLAFLYIMDGFFYHTTALMSQVPVRRI